MKARGLLLVLLLGCAGGSRKGAVSLAPEDAQRWGILPQGQSRPGRHVIRMSDGTRDWEVEFPDVATGYEVRIPLGEGRELGGPPAREKLTAADRELLEDQAQSGVKRASGKPRSSYLAGVARIRELFKSRNYELALVQCVDLERDWPDDEKLLAMKGSIYKKLGKAKLARETWERVLQLNPDNGTVAEALRDLSEAPSELDAGGR